jgi:hypothetical protein
MASARSASRLMPRASVVDPGGPFAGPIHPPNCPSIASPLRPRVDSRMLSPIEHAGPSSASVEGPVPIWFRVVNLFVASLPVFVLAAFVHSWAIDGGHVTEGTRVTLEGKSAAFIALDGRWKGTLAGWDQLPLENFEILDRPWKALWSDRGTRIVSAVCCAGRSRTPRPADAPAARRDAQRARNSCRRRCRCRGRRALRSLSRRTRRAPRAAGVSTTRRRSEVELEDLRPRGFAENRYDRHDRGGAKLVPGRDSEFKAEALARRALTRGATRPRRRARRARGPTRTC